MRKFTLSAALLAAALALTAGFTGAARKWEPNLRGTVFVTERGLVPGSITAFDAATGRPIWTSRTGTTPIGVVKPRGTHKVYTSDEGSNQMSVFAEDTGALLKTIPMALGPHHLMATRNGKLIYVGEFLQSTVGVVDTRSDTEIAHYQASLLANARTHSVYITRNGKDLYAANTRADRTQKGDVAHIDARTGKLLCNTEVGVDPSEILVRPSGKRGYVSVRGENKIKELDLRSTCPVLTGREAVIGSMPDTLQLASRPESARRDASRYSSTDLLDGHEDLRGAGRDHPRPYDHRPPLALEERASHVRRSREPGRSCGRRQRDRRRGSRLSVSESARRHPATRSLLRAEAAGRRRRRGVIPMRRTLTTLVAIGAGSPSGRRRRPRGCRLPGAERQDRVRQQPSRFERHLLGEP